MITIYDIAKLTGFSPTTVSKVFNDYPDVSLKTRRKILEAAEQLGYLPNAHARSLTTKRSWTIGILYNESSGIGMLHPYFAGVIEGFKKVATSRGYDLMFISKDIGGKKSGYLEHCKIRGVDGVVGILPDYSDPDFTELLDSDVPMVLLDQESEIKGTVYSDNLDGSIRAVQYLYDLGHRKIGHIGGGNTFAGVKRMQGYLQAMQELRLPIFEEHIIQGSYDYTIESGKIAMEQLLQAVDSPTAVFAAGDNLAIGAMQAIKDHGLSIPGDISIIGFDDIAMAGFLTPSLTTIRQNTHALGNKAADMLIYTIEGGTTISSEVIPVELVARDSCRAIE